MELISLNSIYDKHRVVLRHHVLQVHDNIVNPFSSLSAEYSYIQVVSTRIDYQEDIGINIVIDNSVQEESRTRYSLWTALGDIGGFHDGLTLLMQVVITPIAATLFENDLLKGKLFSSTLTADQKRE